MAEQSHQQSERELKKALHWVIEEVDRLAVCWCAVSTEKGGVGAFQRLDGMWKAIAGTLPIYRLHLYPGIQPGMNVFLGHKWEWSRNGDVYVSRLEST